MSTDPNPTCQPPELSAAYRSRTDLHTGTASRRAGQLLGRYWASLTRSQRPARPDESGDRTRGR